MSASPEFAAKRFWIERGLDDAVEQFLVGRDVVPWRPRSSAWEDLLLEKLQWCDPSRKWYRQVKFALDNITFWLDLGAMVNAGRAIGFECDGPMHADAERDFCRDCLMVGTGRLAAIYRLGVHEVEQRAPEWLALLTRLEPALFSEERRKLVSDIALGMAQNRGGHLGVNLKIGRVRRGLADVEKFLDLASQNKGMAFKKLVGIWKWAKRPT